MSWNSSSESLCELGSRGFEVQGSGLLPRRGQASHPTGLLRRSAPRNDGLQPFRVFGVFRGGAAEG